MVGPAEFAAAGLYDPEIAGAADRLALLEWLTQRGFTIPELVQAVEDCTLAAIAGDRLLMGEITLSMREVADLVGLTLPDMVQLMRAAGFAPTDVDAPAYSTRDVDTFRLFTAARELFSPDELIHFTRIIGSAVARIAEAANSLFLEDVERPLANAGGGEFALATANMQAIQLLDQVSTVMDTLLRQHVRETTGRFRGVYRRSPGPCIDMAIGFVDLCGFTARSAELSPADLLRVVSHFESQAYDIVSGHGGRVVKLIGDEVMFTAVEPATACDIAVALVAAFDATALTPRGGIAFGQVLSRSGDYYGPIVNLASRIADQAVPGEILATPPVADGAPDHAFAPAGRRLLKGFTEPVELVSLS